MIPYPDWPVLGVEGPAEFGEAGWSESGAHSLTLKWGSDPDGGDPWFSECRDYADGPWIRVLSELIPVRIPIGGGNAVRRGVKSLEREMEMRLNNVGIEYTADRSLPQSWDPVDPPKDCPGVVIVDGVRRRCEEVVVGRYRGTRFLYEGVIVTTVDRDWPNPNELIVLTDLSTIEGMAPR